MSDFIGKPVDPLELFATILKWLPKASNVHLSVLQAPQPERAAEASPLAIRLRALAGVDLDEGLISVRGDIGWYWKLLREFLSFHADDMLQVRKSIERQQQSNAIRLAHTLKGAAATLGLVTVKDLAQQMESTLTNGLVDIEEQAVGIGNALQQLSQAVQTIEQEQTQPPAPTNLNQSDEVLTELQSALHAGDFHANQIFHHHQAFLRSSLPHGVFTQLESAVESYEFEHAFQLIEKLRATPK